MRPLDAITVLTLGVNLPAPLAGFRLHQLGATVFKIEPPEGDPLEEARPEWYRDLHAGQTVVRLDLAAAADRGRLEGMLKSADLLLTSYRPRALARLGLAWEDLSGRHPRLLCVSIVGFTEDEALPGHDLTYQARHGLLTPPHLPRALIGDLAGAQEAVGAALALLLQRGRGGTERSARVGLADAVRFFAEPLRRGLTAPGGLLGGGVPGYGLYRSSDGWIAVAALERRFADRLAAELGLREPGREELQRAFLGRTAGEWERWAAARDLPLAAVVGAAAGDAAAGSTPAGEGDRGGARDREER
jgi:crotonobetainyl-CoA:carnitine CoA-transferase CaiB-like acyl-CoA transferase